MAHKLPAILVALLLASCAPDAPKASQSSGAGAAPVPPPAMASVYADCVWSEVRGAGLSIWAFKCAQDEIRGDEALPGFVRETGFEGAAHIQPVIRVFAKAADAGIDAVLPAARAASPGPGTAACTFEPLTDLPGAFRLAPTGATRVAYEAFLAGAAEEPSQPCGELGPSETGERFFQVLNAAPDKVIFYELPSDVPIFDIATLRPAG